MYVCVARWCRPNPGDTDLERQCVDLRYVYMYFATMPARGPWPARDGSMNLALEILGEISLVANWNFPSIGEATKLCARVRWDFWLGKAATTVCMERWSTCLISDVFWDALISANWAEILVSWVFMWMHLLWAWVESESRRESRFKVRWNEIKTYLKEVTLKCKHRKGCK